MQPRQPLIIVGVSDIRDGELSEVVSRHLWPDFNLVERLAVVDTHHRPHHLGDNHHVTQVRLDSLWLLLFVPQRVIHECIG